MLFTFLPFYLFLSARKRLIIVAFITTWRHFPPSTYIVNRVSIHKFCFVRSTILWVVSFQHVSTCHLLSVVSLYTPGHSLLPVTSSKYTVNTRGVQPSSLLAYFKFKYKLRSRLRNALIKYVFNIQVKLITKIIKRKSKNELISNELQMTEIVKREQVGRIQSF